MPARPAGAGDSLPGPQTRDWVTDSAAVVVETVTSHGPVSAKRHAELEAALSGCGLARVYVTAFPTRAEFRQYAAEVAWETEVWIADQPGHMIHFNGPKFLGPYPAAGSDEAA